MNPRTHFYFFAAGVGLLAATSAQAQDGGATQAVPAPAADQQPIAVAPDAAPAAASPADSKQLAEVVVTATKRKESTRNIAGGVTAITQEQLSQAGASSMAEYLSLAPGVNFDSSVPGYSVIAIRGISGDTIPGETQSAVGTYYDDIPLTDPGLPLVVPDIDAFDAARIEILRGPQGALYGSASLGGAVNYIPDSPDPLHSQIGVFATGSETRNSTLGGTGKLMMNFPIYGTGGAVRLVGYDVYQPGYIGNVGTETPHANVVRIRGGRVMLGWALPWNSTLKISALYQRTTLSDQGYVDSNLPPLEKSSLVPEPSSNDLKLADLHYSVDLGFASLLAIGGYQEKHMTEDLDGSTALGVQSTGLQFPLTQVGHSRGYSAELRLVSRPGKSFNWLAGVSYVYHNEFFDVGLASQTLNGALTLLGDLGVAPPTTLSDATVLFNEGATIRAPEEAAFFEGSYRLGPVKLTAGGRAYRNLVNSSTLAVGALLLPAGSDDIQTRQSQKADGFNPKVSLSYDLTKGIMLYTLYSKGYRLGGPNVVPITPLTSAKAYYSPDSVRNVEVGVKSRWWHGRLTAEVSAYDIGWNNIPLVVEDSAGLFKYLENAGDARAKGVETAFAIHPLDFLTYRTAVSYGDSRLKSEFNPNNGRPAAPAGTQLPGAPDWTVTNTLTAQWGWGEHDPTVTLIHRYLGASPSNISYTDVKIGNYQTLDVRAGFKLFGISLTAFAKNVTDTFAKSAILNQPLTTGGDLEHIFILPPRSVGLELSYNFER